MRPRAPQLRLLLRILALGALVLALKSFVLDPLTGHFTGSFDDFGQYLNTARSVASGGSPYAWFSATTPVSAAFAYPPFAVLLVRPLASLSDSAALSLWLALMLVATLAAAIVVARVTLPATWPRVELAVLGALAFAPVTYNYWHGQINGLIFLLLALGLWAYTTERTRTAGIVLGLAAGIKVAPVVLLFLLLRRRWWRSAAYMALTIAGTIATGVWVFGAGATHTFVSTVLPTLSRPTGWIYNLSVPGSLARLADQSVLRMQPTPVALAAASIVAAIVLVGASLWPVRATDRPRPERAAEFGLAIVAMLLAGSLVEFAHFTALLIPLFAAAGLAASRGWRSERPLLGAAALATVAFGLVAPQLIALLASQVISLGALAHSPWWWPFLQLCSLPCLAALWLGVRLRRSLATAGRHPQVTRDEVALAGR